MKKRTMPVDAMTATGVKLSQSAIDKQVRSNFAVASHLKNVPASVLRAEASRIRKAAQAMFAFPKIVESYALMAAAHEMMADRIEAEQKSIRDYNRAFEVEVSAMSQQTFLRWNPTFTEEEALQRIAKAKAIVNKSAEKLSVAHG